MELILKTMNEKTAVSGCDGMIVATTIGAGDAEGLSCAQVARWLQGWPRVVAMTNERLGILREWFGVGLVLWLVAPDEG